MVTSNAQHNSNDGEVHLDTEKSNETQNTCEMNKKI